MGWPLDGKTPATQGSDAAKRDDAARDAARKRRSGLTRPLSNTGPDDVVQAAKRAIGAAKTATQTAQAAQTAPAQGNAYGPAVAPSGPQGPSTPGSGSTTGA